MEARPPRRPSDITLTTIARADVITRVSLIAIVITIAIVTVIAIVITIAIVTVITIVITIAITTVILIITAVDRSPAHPQRARRPLQRPPRFNTSCGS